MPTPPEKPKSSRGGGRNRIRSTGQPNGRRTSLTPQVQEAIFRALRQGVTRSGAARHVGVSYDAMRDHMGRDPEFLRAVEEAEGQREVRLVGSIKSAANGGDWKAAQYLLEQRHGDEWGKRTTLTIEGPDGAPPTIVHEVKLDAGSSLARLAALAGSLDVLVRVGGFDQLGSGSGGDPPED